MAARFEFKDADTGKDLGSCVAGKGARVRAILRLFDGRDPKPGVESEVATYLWAFMSASSAGLDLGVSVPKKQHMSLDDVCDLMDRLDVTFTTDEEPAPTGGDDSEANPTGASEDAS